MLSLILVVAAPFIIQHIKKNKGNLSEKFYLCLFIGGCFLTSFWAFYASCIYFYDKTAENIKIYKEEIQQLELELDELDTLIIETTSSNSALTDKEIDRALDVFVEKKKELEEQIDSNNAEIDNLLHYNNPKILKMAKFLIYFG